MATKRITLFGSRGGKRRKTRTVKVVERTFYPLLAALCGWIVLYGSGLFPYLGWGRVQNNTEFATSMDIASFNLGTRWMVLFEGQTVFFNYTSYSDESSITFDVKPFYEIGYSDNMQRAHGEGSGRVEIPVTSTGFYLIEHEAAFARGHVYTHYTVSWGAK